MRRRVLLLGLALLSVPMAQAYGDDDDDDDDHNRASHAVVQGRALPLTEILKKIQARLGGEVIGVELKGNRGLLEYKLKVVTPTGRLNEVSVDATTGNIVKSKGDD